MGDPVAVLVVPAEGDPGGLLAPRHVALAPFPPLDSAVQDAWTGHVPRVTLATSVPWSSPKHAERYALPLWWDGALVPEGWDRLHRICWPVGDVERNPGLAEVLYWMGDLAVLHPRSVSRVVLLDRVDGRLVERAP